ncbi:NAD-dependent epimerase/dehydratase family protein [Limnoglobus roseus]|uniref:Nucleotide sugar epimerase n=1 Tax=Limnoglobus roseus TaxID=2598579 RepID=A0A5C1AEJ8_9BACT|nr:NAD-dependent epimerase/dehydratase family protein [Limnoglobus roseus]QEL17170.1 nucleotide sugar epimerase [Limnoglobus roseus]
MRCLVTGAAGFIGSHLCERLIADGHTVRGVDCFTDYYPRPVKERNLANLRGHAQFTLHEFDLADGVPTAAVDGVEWLFHIAAMPGLNKSWTHFDEYNRCNLVATHRLLESVKESKTLKKLIYASTSSVYGKYASGDETLPTKPSSPYGITKLSGEQLCRVYGDEFGVPTVVLRFFSVYGPRQRPEMGIHQFINAVLTGRPIKLTGDGLHVRGNTFVHDCVDAVVKSTAAMTGETFNLGGGELVTVLDTIRKIERLSGRAATIERHPPRKGDQFATGADVGKLFKHVGWKPTTSMDDGLAQQIEWQKTLL